MFQHRRLTPVRQEVKLLFTWLELERRDGFGFLWSCLTPHAVFINTPNWRTGKVTVLTLLFPGQRQLTVAAPTHVLTLYEGFTGVMHADVQISRDFNALFTKPMSFTCAVGESLQLWARHLLESRAGASAPNVQLCGNDIFTYFLIYKEETQLPSSNHHNLILYTHTGLIIFLFLIYSFL